MIRNIQNGRLLVTIWVIIVATAGPGFSLQQLQISKNPDFSTEDRVFDRSDVLYIRVSAPELDYTDIDKSELHLRHEGAAPGIESFFHNGLDGTYEASFNLEGTESGVSEWFVGMWIEDESANQFRREVEIRIHSEGDLEIQLRGRIQLLSSSALTIRGIEFLMTEETEILEGGLLGGVLSLLLPVEIRAYVDSNGNLVATTITILLSPGGNEDELELVGEVLALTSNTIVIQGVSFAVDQATEILNTAGQPIPLSLIQPGFIVDAEGDWQGESWSATNIKIEDFFDDEIGITGSIESLSDPGLLVSGNVFTLDAATAILDSEGSLIDLQDLQAGILVDILADILPDGSLRAEMIRIAVRFEDEVELKGTVEVLNVGNLLVSGLLVYFDGNTEIIDKDRLPIDPGSLTEGKIIEVVADEQPDRRLLARRIQLAERLQDEVELGGVIEAKSPNGITVGALEFRVVENTAVLNNGGAPIDFDNLFPGRVVKIRGDILPDGTLIAIRIEQKSRDEKEVEVVGAIDSLASDGLKVLGLWFSVTDTTEVLNRNNDPMDFSLLSAGRNIEVKSTRLAGGMLQAVRVTLQDVMILTGTLESVVNNGVALAGQRILFSSETMILSRLNEFVSIDDLSPGQVVEVRAERFDTTAFATKVRVRDPHLVASVEAQEDTRPFVPSDFELEQNYPNPFNPVTRIAFRIAGSGPVSASLVVYNLIGQRVRVLLDSELAPGEYQVTWDGRAQGGRGLATGVYLYELTVNGIPTVKRMLLLR